MRGRGERLKHRGRGHGHRRSGERHRIGDRAIGRTPGFGEQRGRRERLGEVEAGRGEARRRGVERAAFGLMVDRREGCGRFKPAEVEQRRLVERERSESLDVLRCSAVERRPGGLGVAVRLRLGRGLDRHSDSGDGHRGARALAGRAGDAEVGGIAAGRVADGDGARARDVGDGDEAVGAAAHVDLELRPGDPHIAAGDEVGARGDGKILAEVDHVARRIIGDGGDARGIGQHEHVVARAADQIVGPAAGGQHIVAGIAVEALGEGIAGEVDRGCAFGRAQRLDALPGAQREAGESDREVVALARILEDRVAGGIDIIEIIAGPALQIVVALARRRGSRCRPGRRGSRCRLRRRDD